MRRIDRMAFTVSVPISGLRDRRRIEEAALARPRFIIKKITGSSCIRPKASAVVRAGIVTFCSALMYVRHSHTTSCVYQRVVSGTATSEVSNDIGWALAGSLTSRRRAPSVCQFCRRRQEQQEQCRLPASAKSSFVMVHASASPQVVTLGAARQWREPAGPDDAHKRSHPPVPPHAGLRLLSRGN
jgi:hypothetical protein